ncbi:hypothetical protein RHSIM_Rhsim04G0056500 [Rhododendron simsii]|uniref:Retrotransposon Copia-like N-terminal domain-containing protein n=1 Tax=Rhododendron simsii TaxID=118357 RepID=A0A834H1I3_RHOSS|nr:hypothetical protein RHSIM_Rhsim04G0056500 [Rhododendron simsii]
MAEKEKDTESSKNSAKPEANEYSNPNDPFYIHHSDQPGLILVTQPLTEENYNTWSRAMLMALNIKNKEGFVNGTIQQPSTTSTTEFQQWRRCNNLVKAWLFNSISEDIKASVIYNESAHEIWTDLKERFSRTNSVHLFHVEEAIHDCKQDNMTIGAYYTKLKGLWDERDALCCIPTCTCGTVKEVLQFQQSQRTMKFLMGLNEAYIAVRGQILLMDPLPTVNKAHSLILQDEKQRGISKGSAVMTEATAFATRSNSRNFERAFTPKNPHLKCGNCDKLGHTSETCRAHLKCDFCGWKGHTIDVCRKLKKMNLAGGRSDQQEHKNFLPKANHVNANTAAPSFTLTAEQYQNVMTMLNGNKPNSLANHVGSASAMSDLSGTISCASVFCKEMYWILDTGATDHMVCSADLLSPNSRVTNRTVHLPNGAIAAVTHMGSVHFPVFPQSPTYDDDTFTSSPSSNPNNESFSPEPVSQEAPPSNSTDFSSSGNTLPTAQESLSSSPVLPQRMTRTTTTPVYLREYHVGISLPSRNVPSSNSALVEATGSL